MRCLILLTLLMLVPVSGQALVPAEVAVIANVSVDGSVDLARFYMDKRGIPGENLIRIRTTRKEFCLREQYDNEIAGPVRQFLKNKKDGSAIRCLVTMYGVPLRINPYAWTPQGKKELEGLQEERVDLQKQLDSLSKKEASESDKLNRHILSLDRRIEMVKKKDDRAAVDSELALLMRDNYPVRSWVANPYFVGFQKQALPVPKKDALFVSRLDGPSEEIVRRMITDSLAVEVSGLTGTAYFDARWPNAEKNKRSLYEVYDHSLYLAAEKISIRGNIPVVINDKPELFQAGEAPNAAIYCGWYSVNRYVDAFDWKPGAIAYHIASGECGTLRSASGKGWCKGLIEDGAAATLGPVGEPYLQAFPPPELFFGLLADGYYTLAEVYFLSLPYLSWQMILVGDPLYRPFKAK